MIVCNGIKTKNILRHLKVMFLFL